MTEAKLKQIVTEAVELDREIQLQTERLKEFKKILVAEAESREEELEKLDGGGTRWMAEGSNDCVARVNFPARTLKSNIDPETEDGQKLIKKLGGAKKQLLDTVFSYAPVQNFRDLVKEIFAPGDAKAIIKLAESKSSPRVSFETKEKAAA